MGNETSSVEQDLRAFAAFQKREGLPPTVRDFQFEIGLSSPSVATYHLKRLAEHGYVRRRAEGESRGWLLTEKGIAESYA